MTLIRWIRWLFSERNPVLLLSDRELRVLPNPSPTNWKIYFIIGPRSRSTSRFIFRSSLCWALNLNRTIWETTTRNNFTLTFLLSVQMVEYFIAEDEIVENYDHWNFHTNVSLTFGEEHTDLANKWLKPWPFIWSCRQKAPNISEKIIRFESDWVWIESVSKN